MANAAPPDADFQPPAPPSRGLLDPERRKLLLVLLTKGMSRRTAARFVGCHTAAVGRTAARDPEFAQQLAEAEARLGITALDAMTAAASNPRYWQAAAWLLQRIYPDQFNQRPPQVITAEDLGHVINRVMDDVAATDITDEQLADLEGRVQQYAADVVAGSSGEGQPPLRPSPAGSVLNPRASSGPAASPPRHPPPKPTARNTPPERAAAAQSPQPSGRQAVASPIPTAADPAQPTQGVARPPSAQPTNNPRDDHGSPPRRPTS